AIAASEDSDAKGEVVWAGEGVGDFPDIEAYAGFDCRWWREAIERVIGSGKREIAPPADATSPPDAARSADARVLEIPRGTRIESLAILPMIARGRTVGVLSL